MVYALVVDQILAKIKEFSSRSSIEFSILLSAMKTASLATTLRLIQDKVRGTESYR